ncbi:MAG: hypothetical protein LBJ13_00225 [Puniceicoccales bacterium]|nr:hypothetical protein [Puniceicoccales bacterium]
MIYKIYGNQSSQTENISEIPSTFNFVLSQNQRPSNFRDLLFAENCFSFIQKRDSEETDLTQSVVDTVDNKVLQSLEQSRCIKILMILWQGETDAERGFLDTLKAMGYLVTPTIIDVDRDLKRLRQTLHFEINFEDYDYIYTFGTRVSLVVNEYVNNKVPIIFNAVGYPAKSGLVNDDPGRNINDGGNFSGVGTAAPMTIQLGNIQKIFKMQRLAFLVNPQEQNSLYTSDMIEDTTSQFGITSKHFNATNKEEIFLALAKIKSASSPFDALYVPSGSPFTENSKAIFDFGCAEKIAMICEKEDMICAGALMGTVAKCKEGGQLAAKIVDMNHRYRIAMAHIPIQYPKFYCIVNRETAEVFGVKPNPQKINFQWTNTQASF